MHLQSQTKAVCERIIAEWEMHYKLPLHNTEQLTTVLLLSKRGLIFFFPAWWHTVYCRKNKGLDLSQLRTLQGPATLYYRLFVVNHRVKQRETERQRMSKLICILTTISSISDILQQWRSWLIIKKKNKPKSCIWNFNKYFRFWRQSERKNNTPNQSFWRLPPPPLLRSETWLDRTFNI